VPHKKKAGGVFGGGFFPLFLLSLARTTHTHTQTHLTQLISALKPKNSKRRLRRRILVAANLTLSLSSLLHKPHTHTQAHTHLTKLIFLGKKKIASGLCGGEC